MSGPGKRSGTAMVASMATVLLGCNGGLPFGSELPDLLTPPSADLAFAPPDLAVDLAPPDDLAPAPDLAVPVRTLGFVPGKAYSLAQGAVPASIVAGDFNRDGHNDVAVSSKGKYQVNVLPGDGKGGLLAPIATGVVNLTDGLATADLNGDGKLDLVVTMISGMGYVSTLLGHGDGTFDGALQHACSPGPIGVALGDLDGDKHLDAAVVGQSPGLDLLTGRRDGTFAPFQNLAHDVVAAQTLAAGDLDKDGLSDLVIAATRLYVLRGAALQANPTPYTGGTEPRSPAVVDLDGDGLPDVVAVDQGAKDGKALLAWINQGQALEAVKRYPLSPGRALVAADFNGDGRQDVAVSRYQAGGVAVVLGDGRGGFKAPVDFGDLTDGYSLVATDLDHDDLPDLVVVDGKAALIQVLRNTSR